MTTKNPPEWDDAVTDFLTTKPGDPSEREKWERAMAEDRKLRESGVFPPKR
jgi:hypothetical protein